ncbi:MAG: hypothetical protein NT003_02580 [Candidatus Magasanikbacteria bacterium]|nr:hypothetical protein [Candidatus Magasanikbacteria bacterium]
MNARAVGIRKDLDEIFEHVGERPVILIIGSGDVAKGIARAFLAQPEDRIVILAEQSLEHLVITCTELANELPPEKKKRLKLLELIPVVKEQCECLRDWLIEHNRRIDLLVLAKYDLILDTPTGSDRKEFRAAQHENTPNFVAKQIPLTALHACIDRIVVVGSQVTKFPDSNLRQYRLLGFHWNMRNVENMIAGFWAAHCSTNPALASRIIVWPFPFQPGNTVRSDNPKIAEDLLLPLIKDWW